jgi:LacI family transcriptional regulator
MLNVRRKTTLQDIGRRLGVSATTISLALRDHPRISAATKEKVRALIAELKYEPDQVARALVSGRSQLVGVIVPNSTDRYYAEVLKGIEDAARSANHHVIFSNGSYGLDGYAQRVKEMMNLRVSGIVAAPPFTSERPRLPQFWQDLLQSKFPFVLVNRHLKPAIFHQVSADYNSGVRMAVEALTSLNHRRVAYISGHPALLPIRQRLADFRRFAKKHNFESDPGLFADSELNAAGGYAACKRLWEAQRNKPTAIVAFSDTVAVGALRYLLQQKVNVPEDTSLIGFDGTAVTEFTTPALSTIETPMYEIGTQSFGLLLGAIEGRYSFPQDLNLPVRLLLRESVTAAAVRRRIA